MKGFLYQLLRRGLERLPQSGIPVLLYHRIGTEEEAGQNAVTCISTAQFRSQVDFLKNNGYRFLSLDEVVKTVTSAERPHAKAVAITFDDGFDCNYRNAMPILKEAGAVATVFLATGFVGRELTGGEAFGSTVPERKAARYRFLNWEQISEMHAAGVDFQPHTHTHPDLTRLSLSEAEREMLASRDILEERLGKRCRHLSYPLGYCNPEVKRLARRAGFDSAWAVRPFNAAPGMDLFELPRKNSGATADEFRMVLSAHYNCVKVLSGLKNGLKCLF